MASDLLLFFRNICCDSGWTYAVFWKLDHRSPMVLTWKHVYYDNFSENKFSRRPSEERFDGEDPLGLALAKMSCQIYSLGEGIVGQVAISGKYHWVTAQIHAPSSSEYHDEWEAQFSAGIKTVVVIPVVPHGVVQLGSLNTIVEDVDVVCHIRDFFSTLQESPPYPKLSGTRSSSCLVNTSLPNPTNFSGNSLDVLSHDSSTDITNIYSSLLPIERIGVDVTYFPKKPPDSSVCDGVKLSDYEVHQNAIFQNVKEMEEFQNKSCGMGQYDSSLKFPAGFELHEALGPAFLKELNCFDRKIENSEDGITSEMPERMNCCQSTSTNSHLEHLLEAIVSNVNHEVSICKSTQSLLTTEKYSGLSSHASQTVLSAGYSIDQLSSSFIGEDSQHCMSSSGAGGMTSPKTVSSKCLSKCSQQSDPAKKKRAKPGENCRPRPRDRQLIQDRIKELRELVPNGAKCSIDSLLERTIQHMQFLQGIAKHADKLNKCANTKLHQMGNGMIGPSSNEEGSSWAVEVGGHLKVCSIIVENVNKNGQILVEMLCEECSHFLEIAGAIKSLGLSILKGTTEAYGEKIWICFIVEGENNRSIHRMDILWSLVQILQPKNVI